MCLYMCASPYLTALLFGIHKFLKEAVGHDREMRGGVVRRTGLSGQACTHALADYGRAWQVKPASTTVQPQPTLFRDTPGVFRVSLPNRDGDHQHPHT